MRIVIAEDSVVIREGLTRLLNYHGHTVVAEAGDERGLRAGVLEHHPDLAIVDIRMPPHHTDEGLRAAIALRRDHPDVGIMLFSQYVETRYATELLADQPGGVGYLLKDRVSAVEDFLDALVRVAAGGTALDPEVVAQLLRARRRQDPLDRLTSREREVLSLMAEGRSNTAIAQRLVIGERAVEKHISHIFSKLDLSLVGDGHRRVLAVLRYLEQAGPATSFG